MSEESFEGYFHCRLLKPGPGGKKETDSIVFQWGRRAFILGKILPIFPPLVRGRGLEHRAAGGQERLAHFGRPMEAWSIRAAMGALTPELDVTPGPVHARRACSAAGSAGAGSYTRDPDGQWRLSNSNKNGEMPLLPMLPAPHQAQSRVARPGRVVRFTSECSDIPSEELAAAPVAADASSGPTPADVAATASSRSHAAAESPPPACSVPKPAAVAAGADPPFCHSTVQLVHKECDSPAPLHEQVATEDSRQAVPVSRGDSKRPPSRTAPLRRKGIDRTDEDLTAAVMAAYLLLGLHPEAGLFRLGTTPT